MTINFVELDQVEFISSQILERCSVPREMYAFYEIQEIKDMGTKLHSNIFMLDGLIFKLVHNTIDKAYFPLNLFQRFPNLL